MNKLVIRLDEFNWLVLVTMETPSCWLSWNFLEESLEEVLLFSEFSLCLVDSWENIIFCIWLGEKDSVDCNVITPSFFPLTSSKIFSLSSLSWRFFAVVMSAAWHLRNFVLRFWNQTWISKKLVQNWQKTRIEKLYSTSRKQQEVFLLNLLNAWKKWLH